MKIGVIGLGYVGLPLAVAFAEEGHEVVGLDSDGRKMATLGEGRSYVEDVSEEALRRVARQPAAQHRLCGSCLVSRGDRSACRRR